MSRLTKGVTITVEPQEVQEIASQVAMSEYLGEVFETLDKMDTSMLESHQATRKET